MTWRVLFRETSDNEDEARIARRIQGLVIREYVPLRTYEIGINGLPVTQEWRCFFAGEELIAAGYYWAQAEEADLRGELPEPARQLAEAAASRLAEHVPFFVVDVGERVQAPYPEPGCEDSAGWTVIEVNSAQMAGLSCVDPAPFYERLRQLAPTLAP